MIQTHVITKNELGRITTHPKGICNLTDVTTYTIHLQNAYVMLKSLLHPYVTFPCLIVMLYF